MAANQPPGDNPSPDLTFYTELRYPGPSDDIIRAYATALRRRLARQAQDLRFGARGEFGGLTDSLAAALADGVDQMQGHVDAFESAALANSGDPALDHTVRNIVANVISDASVTALAEAHATSPKAREGKFDQHQGAVINGSEIDVADKLWQLTDLLSGPLGAVVNIISLILRDIGLFGPAAAGISLAEVGYQLESKLDHALPQIEGLSQGQASAMSTLLDINRILTMTQQEVYRVEQKADTLGDLLGRTLVGEGWIVDPYRTRSGSNKVPVCDVKQELHDIEERLKENCAIIEGPPDGDGNGDTKDGHDKPRHERRPVLRDRRLKKIFVYAENIFSAAGPTDRRRVRVVTPAFDLGGWLDLSRLRPGDTVEVDIRISFANRHDIRVAKTEFRQPKLVGFAEISGGQNYLIGNNVLIAIRQSASADNFATRVELAYQFIAESC